MLNSCSLAETPYSVDRTVIDFFEEQVENNRDRVAVIFEDSMLTYGELNNRANGVAHLMRSRGIGRNALVPVRMPRCLEMIVAIFGIMKAGAAYLPIDLSSPSQRLLHILQEARVSCLLTCSTEPPIEGFFGETISLDRLDLGIQLFPNPTKINERHDLAYVCYTSGSSGLPKGVEIEHHSLMNRIEWMQREFPLTSGDRLFQKTAISFDVSIWEMFWWAMVGASVVLLPSRKEHDPKTLSRLIRWHQITVIHFVPSVLDLFLDHLSHQERGMISSLRWVFSSGEALSSICVKKFYREFNADGSPSLVNLYGPTEATIDVSYFVCDPFVGDEPVPIGRPIQNIRLYVVSEEEEIVGVDQPGELWIAGVGVARGYLNDPERTREKFVSSRKIPEERLYKTGDLVKWRNDGELLYLGRIDHQIKVRGQRVELGEIEFHLNQHKAIKGSAVIALEEEWGGNPFILAFILLRKEREKMCAEIPLSDMEDLRSDVTAFLVPRVPSYMLPNQYSVLEEFPLAASGKLDRKKLEAYAKRQTYTSSC